MAQIIWTEPALLDLDAIAEYITLDKPGAAMNLVRKVFSSTDRLEQFPDTGGQPTELKATRYLDIIVTPCRIFYRIEAEKVYIIYVMRSEITLRKYLLNAREISS
ncbi:Plasmid stabilization system protein [methanotrophic bacterial endosymbiont of Bathymodiolus sp.]|jgi:toxin ParE1/3/4|nr:Plasmid stabilization system protein [methanotrophic bacterial endosymbiont of Bathymodiolus sp.]